MFSVGGKEARVENAGALQNHVNIEVYSFLQNSDMSEMARIA